MKNKIYFLLFAIPLLYSSCFCDCKDEEINSIYFTFKTGTTTDSFTAEEIDTLHIYKLTKNSTTVVDSITTFDSKFYLGVTGIYFKGSSSFWLNDYLIKTQGAKEIMITDLDIQSAQSKTKCKCFVNTVKKFKVDNTSFDFSGKVWNDCNVELTK